MKMIAWMCQTETGLDLRKTLGKKKIYFYLEFIRHES